MSRVGEGLIYQEQVTCWRTVLEEYRTVNNAGDLLIIGVSTCLITTAFYKPLSDQEFISDQIYTITDTLIN